MNASYQQSSWLSSETLEDKANWIGINLNSSNLTEPQDQPFHRWYRFVLSFPPHLVRAYLNDFKLDHGCTVLDPFCGTGTTIVEAKKNAIAAIGLEANLFPHFASSVKIDWSTDPDELLSDATEITENALRVLKGQGIDDNALFPPKISALRSIPAEAATLLIKDSISPLPLHKTLVLLDCLKLYQNRPSYKYGLLALGNALVTTISNLRFGPEVGIGKQKIDVPVVTTWFAEIRKMVSDLHQIQDQQWPSCAIHLADARNVQQILEPCSVDAVITSPPYPNEKDYTRTTRLESVLLGFIENKTQLRELKKRLVRSNTRSVYTADQDDLWVANHPEIQRIAAEIEERRRTLGKTSGFEKLYPRVTKLYFGGMARHLAELRTVLRPGAQLAYVVGDQASYLQVMIRTGELLADIADRLGYTVTRIDLFRTRFATATQSELREEVVVLRWPGQ
jgi:DNA modification methylase